MNRWRWEKKCIWSAAITLCVTVMLLCVHCIQSVFKGRCYTQNWTQTQLSSFSLSDWTCNHGYQMTQHNGIDFFRVYDQSVLLLNLDFIQKPFISKSSSCWSVVLVCVSQCKWCCVLPMLLVCSRGSAVRTGSVALDGRPGPALLTARTLNWYRVPSFSPNTG